MPRPEHKNALLKLQGGATLQWGTTVIGESADGLTIEVAEDSTLWNKADQIAGATGRFGFDVSVTVRANLERFTAENLALALGGSVQRSANTETVEIKAPGLHPQGRFVAYGTRADGTKVRLVLEACSVQGGFSTTWAKSAPAVIPVVFEGYVTETTGRVGYFVFGEEPSSNT